MEDKYTLEEFGQMIKSKYPDYEDLDNLELANRMLEKYPTYQDMIVKKKSSSASKLQNPFMAFMPDSEAGSTDLDFTQVTNPDPQGEKNFIGGSFGDLVNAVPGVGDFIDDTARAIYVGQGQSANIDKTFALMAGGVGVERETVESYVNAANDWQIIQDTVGSSDEMQEFQKTYAENGNSAFGFIKGLAQNPTILPEVFFQSMAGMANKVSLTEGAAVLGGGAAVGSVVPGVGTAAGLLTAMPAALGVMGGTLETASSFSEFLREELGEREFNTDNVLAVMQDPEAYSRMRNKSIARGAVTGVFDAFGGKLVSSVGGKVLAKTGSKLKTTGTGLAIESVSGGAGEVTARAVTGQEQDVAETGFEMFAGMTTAPISVGAVLLNPPKYSINKGASNRNEVIDVINTATPDQIKDGILDRISVKNDKEVSTLIEGKKLMSEVDSEIDPRVKGEDRSKLVKLELERKKYADSKLKSSKNRLQEIDSQIDEITSKAVEEAKLQELESAQPGDQLELNLDVEKAPVQPSEPDVSLQESKPKSQMSQLERFFYRKRRDITLGGKQYDKFSRLRKLKASWDKTFKSNSGLKPEVGEIYRQLNRDVAAYSDKINVEAGAINDLRNKASKKASKEVTNERYELMNQYLQGNKDVNLDFLNEEDLKVLDYSRDKIDSLSVRIIDVLNARIQEGNLKGEQLEATQSLIETITANDGQYIKRTYQAFTDPKYIEALTIPRDQMNAVAGKKFDDAVSYLEEVEGYTYEDARSEIVKYIDGIANKTTSELGMGRAGSASAPFLRKKKDMPEVFKKLLGEAKDPLYNYANTTEKLSSFLASLDYQQLLSDTILETGIGSKTAKDGYTKFSPNSAEWSYLKDIYVPKEFKEAFDSLAPLGALDNGFYKALVNMASAGKLGKTVLSPTATFRNLMSGVLLGLNSGHLFALSPDRIANSVSMAWGPVRNKKQLQAEREQLIKLGVVGDAARSGELVSVLNDFSSLRADPSKQGIGRGIIEFAKQFYAFGDDFYKTIGFYQEKQKFMDSGMNQGQAAVKAAERIRGGYPTYSYVPTNIRKLRRNPFVGSFVSFPYEVVRTTKNNALYALEDLLAGRTKMAMSRIAGMVTAGLGIGALSTASKNLLDLTDEDDENIREIVPFYQENSELIYAGKDENSATFIDGTALFPSEAIFKPIRMILENPRDEDLGQRVVDAIEEIAAPYIGLDFTTKTGYELLKNENSFGSKIYDEGEGVSSIPLLNGALNDPKGIFNYLAKKAGPGVYNNLQELARALELNPEYFGEKINRYKEYTVENALLGLIGFRVSTANYYQGVSGKIREEKEIQIEAQSAQVGSLSSSRLMSEEEISSAFDSYSRYNKRFQDKAIGFAKTGRSLGMSEDRIIGALIGGGMSKEDAKTAANGGYAPLSVVSKSRYTKKIKSIESQEDVYGKEKTDEMVSLYEKNVEVFNNLVKEYEIEVPDIIKN